MMNKRKANTRGMKRMLLVEKCRHLRRQRKDCHHDD